MTSAFSINFSVHDITRTVSHIPQYIQEQFTDGCQMIYRTAMRPIVWCQESLQRIAETISSLALRNFESAKAALLNVCEQLYSNRYTLLYLSSVSIVALNNTYLFMGAIAVGAIFSLVFSTITQSTKFDPDLSDTNTKKDLMLAQTTLSFVYASSQVMNASRWIHTSTEGHISAGLSGAMFGHLVATCIKKAALGLSSMTTMEEGSSKII